MALVLFESRVNMITAATPSIGGFVVAYDTLDGVLKQKDHLGVITPIGSGGGIGSLSQTLSIGSTTGTNSVYLDINSHVRSSGGSASLRLDNGSSGNYVELSSSNSITGSTLAMSDTNILLKGLSSSLTMNTSSVSLIFGINQFLLQNNNSYLRLGSTNVLEFTTSTATRATGNRVPAFISSNGSRFSNTVTNSVILGGSSIVGTQSNSVYVPNLIIKDGGYVKGTSGDGQLIFNGNNEAYISSGTKIIGMLETNSSTILNNNGIIITDMVTGTSVDITTPSTTVNTFISTSDTTIDPSINNTVVIGGQFLTIDSSNTVYLGGTVDINNQYKLPTLDGVSGQVIKTDGAGNLSWSSGVGTPVITVTAAAFTALSSFSSSSTYRITGVDIDLYGGTEIYLTTNSQGVLNEVGEGKFYNPRYDQTVHGYKIWEGTSSSYATGSTVYWGGRAWSNNSGTNTSSALTIFFLNPTEWTVIPYTNGLYYDISYDKIMYDRVTDKIIYRNEKGTNIVSTNSENIRYWVDDIGLYNPIKVFQWGNLYNSLNAKGIASQNIVNSYNENINFRGVLQTNITMNNLSSQFNMNTGTSSVQDNLILNNYSYDRQSTLLGTEYNMSFQSGDTITIDGNLVVQGTTTTINSENLIVKDPIIVLAASQSGTPTLDSGLFVDRGIGATQAFIWDESMDEFKFISTTSGATVSGNVSITDYSNVRTGVLKVGTGDFDSNDRFVVSSSGGTVSLIVDESGSVYNRGRAGIATNTVFGLSALSSNTSGYRNTAIGASALLSNTLGFENTSVGASTLLLNTTGSRNTAVGDSSLRSNTTGFSNTAIGVASLYSNTTGVSNTALGVYSLVNNKTGDSNTALGSDSLRFNITGSNNTAVGYYSLYNNTNGVILDEFSFSSGTGYVDGTYTNVTLVYATGSSTFLVAPIVEIEVVGGQVTYVGTISAGNGFEDTTTIFTITSYGTYSVGSGFEIGIIALYSGNSNTAIGYQSLYSNTTGSNNTAIGYQSLVNNKTGSDNIALGRNPLHLNTTGINNIALGVQSLYSNTTGFSNIALGLQSLHLNTIGYYNTTIGEQSLYSNTTGNQNNALGWRSLYSNTTGFNNTAIGQSSLYFNTTGNRNIAIGAVPLYFNTTGSNNIALGLQSLYSNTTGYENTALGFNSLFSNTTGWGNIALGISSLQSNTTGDRNTALGYVAMRYYRGLWSVGLGGAALGAASTGIKTLSATFSSGTGYTPGTYSNVRLYWTSGTFWTAPSNSTNDYPTAEIVVGVGGTVSSVTLQNRGVLIPDTTTRFTVQTGTQSYQLGTASGTGFEIGIGTIATASSNTALGYGTMYRLGVGSDNIAIGMWAGTSYGIPGSFNNNALTGSDQSIFIGRFTAALNNDSVNEIVIGNEAVGNGNNTVTLGNDSVTKTILKGNVAVGFTGSVSPNCDLEIKGNQTFTVPDTNSKTSGDVVYFGSGTGLNAGEIYYYNGTTWQLADASVEASSSGLLAIALGANVSDGMLLRGFSKFSDAIYTAMTAGSVQFLSVTPGEFEESQPVSSGEVVRVIGYCIDDTNNILYFCPDTTWIELL